jgi:hypothetical protein
MTERSEVRVMIPWFLLAVGWIIVRFTVQAVEAWAAVHPFISTSLTVLSVVIIGINVLLFGVCMYALFLAMRKK